jgi:hypothetical protein
MMWSIVAALGLGIVVGLAWPNRASLHREYGWLIASLVAVLALFLSWWLIGLWIQEESYAVASGDPYSMWYPLYYLFNQYPHETAFWLTLVGMVLVWSWRTVSPRLTRLSKYILYTAVALVAILGIKFVYENGSPQAQDQLSLLLGLGLIAFFIVSLSGHSVRVKADQKKKKEEEAKKKAAQAHS